MMRLLVVITKEVDDNVEAQEFIDLVTERTEDLNPVQINSTLSEQMHPSFQPS